MFAAEESDAAAIERLGVTHVPAVADAPMPDDDLWLLPCQHGFDAMRSAYLPTGGTARSDDLARLLADREEQDASGLARLIVERQVFGFPWRGSHWVPMFQFDLGDLSVKPGSRRVLAELSMAFDGWRLAAWFAQPNAWLQQRRPVDLLASRLPAVLAAARADRFVAIG